MVQQHIYSLYRRKSFLIKLCVLMLFAIIFPLIVVFSQQQQNMRQDAAEQATLMTTESSSQIYWGATIKGKTLDAAFSDPPWDMRGWDVFEEHAGKKISLLNIGNVWWNCEGTCRYKTFNYQKAQFDAIRNRGAIPFFTWQSQAKGDPNQPDSNFQLADIYRGNHDAFIRQWADEAALWGYPFFMRLDWEMNGSWYMWSEKQNGNQPGDYIKMWKHVWNVVNCVDDGVFHPLSSCVPATNVTWVWNINLDFPGSQPLEELYPGDTYVDWVGIDGYNFGTDPAKPDIWRTFTEAFKPTYDHVTALAPTKPIIVPETASTEYGGSKAQWITDALMREISATFPRIKGIMWFNWAFAESKGIVHYEIESSATAQQAFKDGIASSYFAAGDTIRFGNLPKLTKVKPLNTSIPTTTPTRTPTPQLVPGDATGDGLVNDTDFTRWKCEYLGNGTCASSNTIRSSDFNKNGTVELLDFVIWKNNKI
jgi:mannan endo-1,4-beta-mannosidase